MVHSGLLEYFLQHLGNKHRYYDPRKQGLIKQTHGFPLKQVKKNPCKKAHT